MIKRVVTSESYYGNANIDIIKEGGGIKSDMKKAGVIVDER